MNSKQHRMWMADDDRFQIDTAVVRHLISTQFPHWGRLSLKRVEADGWDNTTFRLGEDMKVRLPTAAGYVSQVEKEYRWLPRLAPLLPLRIPRPLALGAPDHVYPWPWAVYSWLSGEIANSEHIIGQRQFATELAEFLLALQRVDTTDGPPPGPHSFYRGGNLSIYDIETRRALELLREEIDIKPAMAVWEAALAATWRGPDRPVPGIQKGF